MSYDGPNPLPIVAGGTFASSMATVDGVVYYDGTRLVTTTAGVAGQALTSNGPGVAPTYQTLTTSANSFDVQANTAPGTDPVLPTAGGVLIVNGAAVANHSVVLETRSRALNTYNLEVQYAAAAAATDATKSGVSHFNSSQFSVDASGFVELTGGGLAIDSIGTQTGTNPIAPTVGGLVTINGAVVAAGTNPVRSDGTGANTMALEVQISQAIAATDATKIGLANFDSASFDVDANGFVQLNGGGIASTAFDVQANTAPGTDPVVPTAAGVVIVNGAAVANHSVVLETRSRALNTYNLEVQYAAAAAATDATKSGVAHFNSTQFSVDASGFVALAGGGLAIDSIHPDSGTDPVVPTAGGLVNIVGSGSITTVGSLNTLTTQLTGLTNHAVLVGAGTTTITKVGPTATVGQVLQSAGAAADPAFSTATYPLTTTVNQILYSSATDTVTGLATANRAVLTTGTSGIPVMTALAVDGQLIIGSTAGSPSASTLTAGTGISITNASNSITIAVTGNGLTWTDVTGATQALLVANGYVTDRGGGVTYTLPATAAVGDAIIIIGKLGLTTIAQNAGQSIRMSSLISTVGVGGSVVGTNVGDCVTLNCTTSGASTVWIATSFVGNWSIV